MTVHVFHRNEVWLEKAEWVPTMHLPPQSYIRRMDKGVATYPLWYLTQHFGMLSNALPINASDVPPWVRTCCLLLNLSV